MLKNTPDQYGVVTKTLHWGMALLIVILLTVGLVMGELPAGTLKLTAYNLHKAFGITVLALVFIRIGWHLHSRKPEALGAKEWEKTAAKALHALFYILMIAMPLSGWLMSSAAGRPVSFFGLFTLPDLIAADKDMKEFFGETHEIIGNLLIAAIAAHAAAALKHHFVDKDNVLRRMLPLLLAAILAATPAMAGDVQKWRIAPDRSSITFRAKQMGEEFTGAFLLFTGAISFDPDNLAGSKAVVEIDTSKATTRAQDRDETLRGSAWFDVATFPAARFETLSFQKTGENTFVAEANLTIRDATVPITLPFTLKISKDDSGNKTAEMDAHIVLDRSKFKLGTGEWADTSVIANDVSVDIHVTALPQK